MKKITKILMLAVIASLFAVANSNAQVIIRARLTPPRERVVIRSAPPSPRHVWVGEEWVPNGATYTYAPGHWVIPPRRGGVWIGGHWADRRGGSYWVAGHWR